MAKIERVFSDEEKKLMAELKTQLSNIKEKGKFKKAYNMIRKGTNDIRKEPNMTETEKKKALLKLCEEVGKEIVSTLQSEKKTK